MSRPFIVTGDATESAQGGFVLLVLLSVIGVGSVGVLLAVQALLPSLRDRQTIAEQHLEIAAHAAEIGYRQNGQFPTDLDSLALAGGVAADGAWRRDPFGSGSELDYRILVGGVLVRARGVDGTLGTSDDAQRYIATETQLRMRQRLRLRMLRAVLLRSAFRWNSLMTPSQQTQMRSAMRAYAVAKRSWLTAGAAERLTLATTMQAARDVVSLLTTTCGLSVLPVSVLGAGGLMSQLTLSDQRAVDGCGASLVLDPVVGWLAVGSDGVEGTDDDM